MKKKQIVFSLTQNQVFGLKGAVFLMLFISKSALFAQHKEKFFVPKMGELEFSREIIPQGKKIGDGHAYMTNFMTILDLPRLNSRFTGFYEYNFGSKIYDHESSFDVKLAKKPLFVSAIWGNDIMGEYRYRNHGQIGIKALPALKKRFYLMSIGLNHSIFGAKNRVGTTELALNAITQPIKTGNWEVSFFVYSKIRAKRSYFLGQIFLKNKHMPKWMVTSGTAKYQKTTVVQDDNTHIETLQIFFGLTYIPKFLNHAH